jgi:hypothetical protein
MRSCVPISAVVFTRDRLNNWQLLRLLGRRDYHFQAPIFMKPDFVDETKSSYCDEGGTRSELPFVCQVDLVRANLIRSQFFQRFAETACEQRDLLQKS